MSMWLDPPRRVLLVGVGDDRDRIEAVLADADADEIVACESAAAARAAATAGTVVCVVGDEVEPPTTDAFEGRAADAGTVDGQPMGKAAPEPSGNPTENPPTDPAAGLAATTAAIRAAAPHAAVVAWADAPDVGTVCRVVDAGAESFVRRADGPDALRDRVEAALDRVERQHVTEQRASVLEAMMERSQVPIYVKDTEGRHVAMSEVPTGMTPENVLGKTDLDIYDDDPAFAREAYEDDMALVENEAGIFGKDEQYTSDGQRFWSRTTKFPWYGADGDVGGIVGLSFPITELKRSEARLELMEDRFDKFASYLSHDLQTPLQVASGALELAQETGDEAAFEKVAAALDRLEEMIEDLGATLREEGALGSGVTRTAFKPLLEEVWSVVDAPAATLRLEIPEGTQVDVPRHTLRPILENLFKNAVVHAGDDVTVTVGLRDWTGFYVADDGPGIPEDEREQIFEEGYTTREEGDGTGLDIVSEVARQHGWTVEVSESDAGGARFDFRGPLIATPHYRSPGEGIPLNESAVVGELTGGDVAYDDADGVWTISADGEDVWGDNNDFRFAYAAVEGPVRLQARVATVPDENPYSKAALMVRTSLDSDAAYGAVGGTPDHGTELLWRPEPGEKGSSSQLEEEPRSEWYRIDRVGDAVTLWYSEEGHDWIAIDQRTLPLEGTAYVGLAVCSGVPGQVGSGRFEDVRLTRLE